MNYFESVFQEFLPQIKEQILYGIYIHTEQPFLSKITTDCLWNCSFPEVCVHLISNFTWKVQSLKESLVVATESFSIELKETIVHKCSTRRCFRNIGGTYAFFCIYQSWVENPHIKSCIKNLIFTGILRTRLENLR